MTPSAMISDTLLQDLEDHLATVVAFAQIALFLRFLGAEIYQFREKLWFITTLSGRAWRGSENCMSEHHWEILEGKNRC